MKKLYNLASAVFLFLTALAAMALLMIYYFRRMFTLPGKLVRGEE